MMRARCLRIAAIASIALISACSETLSAQLVITAENLYDHEEYWPNIVTMAADWMPPAVTPRRPQTLQGVLIRIEDNGRARVDLARFGRVDVAIDETDLVERANGVRRGEIFKHRGNFTMQIGTKLVSSTGNEPGPQPSREIKSAEILLCVFADPRSMEFEPLALQLDRLADDRDLQMIFVPQNVRREDLNFVHSTLRKHNWEVPFTDPAQSAIQTTILIREKPIAPHALLVTREGRVLVDTALNGASAFEVLRAAISTD